MNKCKHCEEINRQRAERNFEKAWENLSKPTGEGLKNLPPQFLPVNPSNTPEENEEEGLKER